MKTIKTICLLILIMLTFTKSLQFGEIPEAERYEQKHSFGEYLSNLDTISTT